MASPTVPNSRTAESRPDDDVTKSLSCGNDYGGDAHEAIGRSGGRCCNLRHTRPTY